METFGHILYHTALLAPSLQDADPWSSTSKLSILVLDLGSVERVRDCTGSGPLVLFFTKRVVLNPLVVKDRLLRAGSKKASPEWKKLQAASLTGDPG